MTHFYVIPLFSSCDDVSDRGPSSKSFEDIFASHTCQNASIHDKGEQKNILDNCQSLNNHFNR